jgi:hypothetical protein
MSNSTIFAFVPLGWSAVFSEEELAVFANQVSQEVYDGFREQYKAKAIAATKAAGMVLKALKAQEIRLHGSPTIYVLLAGQIEAAYSKDGNYSWEPSEILLTDGMLFRTIESLNAAVYAAEREKFSLYAAASKALAEGKRFVIAEDLS